MGLLRKRVKIPWQNTVATHVKLKKAARLSSKGFQKRIVPTWWVLGLCTEQSCVEDREKSRKPARPEALCQICRLCRAHCLGHRGIMEGLRPFLTVHNYG